MQAGFHPSHEVVLQSKIEYIVQTAIEAVTKKCRIPIAESLEAFIVPGLKLLDWLVNPDSRDIFIQILLVFSGRVKFASVSLSLEMTLKRTF